MNDLLKVGAGKALINITNEILPLDGFTSVNDPLHIRAIILESNIRICIISVEITSLFSQTYESMKRIVCEKANVQDENVFITLTHSFAGPHIWEAPKAGEKDSNRPGHKPRSADEIARCAILEKCYYDALEKAVCTAASNMDEVSVGAGIGKSLVNASRDMMTKDGFWIGEDDARTCDHDIRVIRFNKTDGKVKAILFNYGMRSCVMQGVTGADGGRMISSDLCGNAASLIEDGCGEDVVSIFFCGSAADQEPLLKAVYEDLDFEGNRIKVDLSKESNAILKAQALRLSAQVLKAASAVTDYSSTNTLSVKKSTLSLKTKKMNRNLKELKPERKLTFEPDGEKQSDIYLLSIGDIHIVGVQPELDGVTANRIMNSGNQFVMTATQFNGGDKCMPSKIAYEEARYEAQNTPYMPGCAEMVETAVKSMLEA